MCIKRVYKFECPCGTDSYMAIMTPKNIPEKETLRVVLNAFEKHVEEEGNIFDPSKVRKVLDIDEGLRID